VRINYRAKSIVRSLARKGDVLAQTFVDLDESLQEETVSDRIENLTGQVNGDRTNFMCQYPYRPSTLRIYKSGVLQTPESLGYVTETNPENGEFSTSSPVPETDRLVVEYKRA